MILLSEQMKLLVEYQEKQESFHHVRSIIQLNDLSGGQGSDLDEVTKALIQSYISDSFAGQDQKSQKLVAIMNGLSNSNDILLLKLQQSREES